MADTDIQVETQSPNGAQSFEMPAAASVEIEQQPEPTNEPQRLQCPSCERTFGNEGGLRMHVTRIHGDQDKRAAWASAIKRGKEAPSDRSKNDRAATQRAVDAIYRSLTSQQRNTWQKRRRSAFARGTSVDEFNLRELARATGETAQTSIAVVAVDPARALRDERREADRLFALVADATEMLFPKRVPADRILEVAEWQRATMAMLQR